VFDHDQGRERNNLPTLVCVHEPLLDAEHGTVYVYQFKRAEEFRIMVSTTRLLFRKTEQKIISVSNGNKQ